MSLGQVQVSLSPILGALNTQKYHLCDDVLSGSKTSHVSLLQAFLLTPHLPHGTPAPQCCRLSPAPHVETLGLIGAWLSGGTNRKGAYNVFKKLSNLRASRTDNETSFIISNL